MMRRLTILLLVLLAANVFPAAAEEPEKDRYLVGAHYYAWYGKNTWSRIFADPLLGQYSSKDMDVINQQIRWAHDYGIDFFAIGWAGKDRNSNDVIQDYFLKSPEIGKIKFCIAYDMLSRFHRLMKPPFDFDNRTLHKEFVSDFNYLSKHYFSNPQYLKFNGRPVVWLYLGRGMRGNWASALEGARSEVAKNGYDLFIDGDLLWPDRTDMSRLPYFDAASAYVLNQKETFRKEGIYTTGQVVNLASVYFRQWARAVPEVRNKRTGEIVAFHPVINPQFIKPADPFALRYLLNRVDDFRAFAELARDTATYSPAAGAKVIWITSWNEWYEGTSIEPTHNGPRLESNYGFQLLDVIRQVFAPGAPGSELQD